MRQTKQKSLFLSFLDYLQLGQTELLLLDCPHLLCPDVHEVPILVGAAVNRQRTVCLVIKLASSSLEGSNRSLCDFSQLSCNYFCHKFS